jgi:hypothetical protein
MRLFNERIWSGNTKFKSVLPDHIEIPTDFPFFPKNKFRYWNENPEIERYPYCYGYVG